MRAWSYLPDRYLTAAAPVVRVVTDIELPALDDDFARNIVAQGVLLQFGQNLVVERILVRKLAAKRIGRLKFESVIVIGKLNAGFFAGLARLLEKIGGAFVAVGLLALFGFNPRANDELVPDGV